MPLGNLAEKYDNDYGLSYTTPASGSSSRIEDYYFLNKAYDKSVTALNRQQALQSLYELRSECMVENWDGYGASPISLRAYLEAEKILNQLPSALPIPEIVPEPSGAIGFEWYNSSNHFNFLISIKGSKIITYAGIFGEGNETHGTEFYVDVLPPLIARYIKRVSS